MAEFVIRSSGPFFLPQLALSLLTLSLVLAYAVALFRGELKQSEPGWQRTLEPLAGVAVGVGLLGSVVSFCVAFGGFSGVSGAFEVDRIAAGLTMAYTTTAVGLVTALAASFASWTLGVVVR